MGNLSYDVTREELIEAFGAAGKVVDAKVPTDRETGRPRGFAFVEFESDESAAKSIELLNGKDLKGRPLRVNEADSRPPRPGGAGPGFRPGGRGDGPPSYRSDRPASNRGDRPSFPRGDRPGFPRGDRPGFRSEGTFPPPDFQERREGRRFKQKPKKVTPPPKKRRTGEYDDYDDE